MDENIWLAQQFQVNRTRLRAVAYRMLGSPNEAEDAVQEAWLKLSRAGVDGVENLSGWLTTIVARVCLDMLRSRKSRHEESLSVEMPEPVAHTGAGTDPEHEALMADSVGLALLIVLDRLAPAERLAFVLHDLFAVSFDEIAPIVGRTPMAARQLASRARRRVQGEPRVPPTDLSEQREVISRFLAALRSGDLEALVAVLDPEVVVHADQLSESIKQVHGARAWAKQAIPAARGARFAQLALVDGMVGLVVAPRGRLFRALRFTIANGKIAGIDVVTDAERLRQLDLGVLND